MFNIFTVFYLFFLLGCLIASIFIIYHIARYSINKKSSTTMFFLFMTVLVFLLILNISAFGSLDLTRTFDFISNFNINNQSF